MTSLEFQEKLEGRALNAGLSIAADVTNRMEAYYRLLSHWNTRINLTSLELDPLNDRAIDRLLVEPLFAASVISHRKDLWFDLGSGGGSPALPLYLVKPAERLVFVESKERKAAFLREVVRELRLEAVSVEVSRIESLTTEHSATNQVDLITVRAVRLAPAVLSAIRALLRINGQVVLFGSSLRDFEVPGWLSLMPVLPPNIQSGLTTLIKVS